MNISDKYPLLDLAGLLAGLQDATPAKNQTPRGATSHEDEDQVLISTRAKEFQRAYELIAEAPDLRLDKVAQVQDAIRTGAYNVRGELVANKLIMHTLLDALL